MHLPLKYVVTNPPHNYWIHHRPDVTVSKILHHNAELQFLRLRFVEELYSPPRLLKQLLQEITKYHTIGIKPYVRSMFFSDVDIIDVYDSSLEAVLTPENFPFQKVQTNCSGLLECPFLQETYGIGHYPKNFK